MRTTTAAITCCLALACYAIAAPPVTPAPGAGAGAAKPVVSALSVMPFGDGVIQGDKDHPSVRYWLFKRLQEAGYRVSFVGRGAENHGGKNPKSDFDVSHEGHWDWTTATALADVD